MRRKGTVHVKDPTKRKDFEKRAKKIEKKKSGRKFDEAAVIFPTPSSDILQLARFDVFCVGNGFPGANGVPFDIRCVISTASDLLLHNVGAFFFFCLFKGRIDASDEKCVASCEKEKSPVTKKNGTQM